MAQKISFTSFRKGVINLTSDDISEYMYNAAITASTAYDYRDPNNGLSFQQLTTTRLLIIDPDLPVNAAILAAQWQIIWDTAYAPINVKFVANGQNAATEANWKSINDVLASLNWTGNLPITDLTNIYMQIVQLKDNNYIVGTLYTPSQPYLKLGFNAVGGAASLPAAGTAIPYDTIVEQVGTEEADAAAMTPIITGAQKGVVKIATPGKYLICASFDSTAGASNGSDQLWVKIDVFLNGFIKGKAYSPLIAGVNDGGIQITTIIKVSEADLYALGTDKKANLSIIGSHGCVANRALDPNENTQLSVVFLG